MIKKGFDLFKISPQLLYSRGFCVFEPMCCEVCKFCFFHIGNILCRYRKATYEEARIDRLKRRLKKVKKKNDKKRGDADDC